MEKEKTLRIREMSQEDIERVFLINSSSFTTDAWSREAIEREFKLNYSRRFVLEKEGSVIAYAFVWIIKGEAFLMSFAVEKKERGKGYGKIFMEKLIEKLRDEAHVIQLDVRKSNIRAIRLYKSLGFKIVAERPGFYSDGETALLMELKLK